MCLIKEIEEYHFFVGTELQKTLRSATFLVRVIVLVKYVNQKVDLNLNLLSPRTGTLSNFRLPSRDMDLQEDVEHELPVFPEGDPIQGMLTGVLLHVTTRFNNEYEYDIQVNKIRNGSKDGKDEYELVGGYAVDIFLYLQALLNFTYVLRPDIKASFDEWSVRNASIDFYLASYSILVDRAKYLEPTAVIGQSKIYAFMDHAFEGDSQNQNLFIIPFVPRLWFCTGILLIIFIMSFLTLVQFEKENENSAGDMVFQCISLFLQKGSDFPSFRDSTRMAALVFSFAVLIIMASYSGIMTSIFAITRYSITNMETLLNSNYKVMVEVGIDNNSSTIKYMLESMPIVRDLLKKSHQSKFTFSSFKDSIEEVMRVPSTYIIDEETGLETLSVLYDGFPCTWSKIPVFNLKYPWSMYMRKNASFHTGINLGIVRLRERGILRRIRQKWIHNPATACLTEDGADFTGITYSQVRSAMQLLFIIILIVSPFIFLAEKCAALISSYKMGRDNKDKVFIRVHASKENHRLVTKILFQEEDKVFRKAHFYP